jgi:endonuclease YncB( thermonuclease family)
MHPLCALLLLLLPILTQADILAGRVVRVLDGDTLEVLDSALEPHRVRLAGIDAPESGQPFGTRAKQGLLALAAGRELSVHWHKRDRYGRLVGKLFDSELDLNLAMIRAGLAWWYREYASEQSAVDRLVYEGAETKARALRVGLWGEGSPMAPWDWRHSPRDPATDCPCDSQRTCTGPRGGRFCLRPGGTRRYLPRTGETADP